MPMLTTDHGRLTTDMSTPMTPIANFFKLQEHGTTFKREILGGITTFLAMSYIIFVQPGVLSVSGMNFQAVLTATCLAAAAATL